MNQQAQRIPLDVSQESVAGHELADEIFNDLRRFVLMSEYEAVATTLWIFLAHVHDAGSHSPMLAFQSPVPGCGKTTTGRFIACLAPSCLTVTNMSRSVIYRIKKNGGTVPTLLIDEADTYLFDDPQMRGIINGSYTRSGGDVFRPDGDAFEVKAYNAWMPKVLMYIGCAPPSFVDRSIIINLRRLRSGDHVDPMPRDYADTSAMQLRKLQRWAEVSFDELVGANPTIPQQLFNRARDNWRPLLAIASLLSSEWFNRASAAAIRLSAAGSRDPNEQLLYDVRHAFAEIGKAFLPTRDLVAYLNDLVDSPWGDLDYGRGIDAGRLARMLRTFRITPKKVDRAAARNVRGYELQACREAFDTYLPRADAERPEDSEEPEDISATMPNAI